MPSLQNELCSAMVPQRSQFTSRSRTPGADKPFISSLSQFRRTGISSLARSEYRRCSQRRTQRPSLARSAGDHGLAGAACLVRALPRRWCRQPGERQPVKWAVDERPLFEGRCCRHRSQRHGAPMRPREPYQTDRRPVPFMPEARARPHPHQGSASMVPALGGPPGGSPGTRSTGRRRPRRHM